MTRPVAISVVIPTFNRADIVSNAIESVLGQEHPAAELIVVDDGSSDHTQQVLAGFQDRIRVIRQANAGLSAARNAGIQAALSEWVGFLDDDDEYTPERLAIVAAGLMKYPIASVHATNTALVGPNQPEMDLFEMRGLKAGAPTLLERPLAWVLRGCFFAQSLVVRRRVLDELGGFRKTFYEDMDLGVRLSTRRPWIIDERRSLRLIRHEGMDAMSEDWRSQPVERCKALVQIHRNASYLDGLEKGEERQARSGLGTYLIELGDVLCAAGERRSARACFVEAAGTSPSFKSRLKAVAAIVSGGRILRMVRRLSTNKGGFVR